MAWSGSSFSGLCRCFRAGASLRAACRGTWQVGTCAADSCQRCYAALRMGVAPCPAQRRPAAQPAGACKAIALKVASSVPLTGTALHCSVLRSPLGGTSSPSQAHSLAAQRTSCSCCLLPPPPPPAAVPGVDMANHSLAPSARVRLVHSPDACQGATAAEEVCPPEAAEEQAPSMFQLVAGEAGVR